MKKFILSSILIIAASCLFSGCASVKCGATYSEIKQSGALTNQPGKALVIIYANKVGLGRTYAVYANRQAIAELSNDMFYSYYADPGTIVYGCKSGQNPYGAGVIGLLYDIKECDPLTVEANQTYYIALRTFPRDHLKIRTSQDGESDIQNCRSVNAP